MDIFTCSVCHNEFPVLQRTVFDRQELCPECLAALTISCSWCGDRIWRDENYGTDDTPLCRDCYDDHYATCADCVRLIRQHDAFYTSSDSDEAYCLTCFQRRNERSIHDYYYKPDIYFLASVITSIYLSFRFSLFRRTIRRSMRRIMQLREKKLYFGITQRM